MTKQQPKVQPDISPIEIQTEDSPQAKQVERLQRLLAEEQDKRTEERFVFCVIAVILLDVVFFSVMDGFGGPLALLILQILLFTPLARRMGLENMAIIFDRVLSNLVNLKEGSD